MEVVVFQRPRGTYQPAVLPGEPCHKGGSVEPPSKPRPLTSLRNALQSSLAPSQMPRISRKPWLLTPIATSKETLRTSPAQLRLSTMPSRNTHGCSASIERFRHPSSCSGPTPSPQTHGHRRALSAARKLGRGSPDRDVNASDGSGLAAEDLHDNLINSGASPRFSASRLQERRDLLAQKPRRHWRRRTVLNGVSLRTSARQGSR
jgi:hypothetical protein